ncbi:hypothetical protein ACL02O_19100 [Micromonospora sp. MS34]|uniref:hypothetical protein n=1 Tax=Micromonospora sp. MS34 TaxID=3385971 RepID=UPI00399F1CD8
MTGVIDLTAPTIAVLGDASRVTGLTRHLSAAWRVLRTNDIDYVQPGELVLLVCPDVATVARVHRRLPAGSALLVLAEQDAPAAAIADVLQAGADACVRAGSTTILASHLVACQRRRTRPPTPAADRERDPVPAGAHRPDAGWAVTR